MADNADNATLVYHTTIVTPAGKSDEQEQVAVETPYTVMLNEREIGASMVLPTGLEEFGVGFLFGKATLNGRRK